MTSSLVGDPQSHQRVIRQMMRSRLKKSLKELLRKFKFATLVSTRVGAVVTAVPNEKDDLK